ncbi:peptidoglycan DD-metalloendopeptidase family protein [Shewanella cyperi]|uniref:peptidoglycan DD-metalloendopeptidase family protein n=1 Tax=Shewanella cyperi TaxID=2814292 RepID=UPI001A95318E|nr:peptidoglycan DD-metalloendopeptidase family protein [Shewanella cyperi]QSX39839.1 peptidoglycan DD-metalloendopeptidase family protein [Shewanella cyperi]
MRSLSLILCLLMAGCSFQAHRPAPVESLGQGNSSGRDRGTLQSNSYKVKPGDTLYSIAWAAGRDYTEIAWLNRLKKPYTIYPGQVLVLRTTRKLTKSQAEAEAAQRQAAAQKPNDKTYKKQTDKQKQALQNDKRNSTKKTLDPANESAYSVTSSQQKVNPVIHSHDGLPEEVSRWVWPVKGNMIGTFSATEQGNKGIKIAGRRGELISAAADGKVVYAGSALRGYGNLVIIKHNDDYLSAYAHADKILVKEKQQVRAGQTVAKMGSTGTNQVMLHFEIRYHGQSVNPLNYLPKQ